MSKLTRYLSHFISCKFNLPEVIAFYVFLRQNHYPVDGSGQDYTRINKISNENSTFKIIFTFETCFPAGVSIAFDFT